MGEQLVRQLEECRRRITKLEEMNISDPMFAGWMTSVEGREPHCDTQNVIRTLVQQPAFFFETVDREHGSECYFFYSGLKDVEHQFAAMKPQVTLFSRIGLELTAICDRLPSQLQNDLQLPKKANWWRILHHIAWHFRQPQLLEAYRARLLKDQGLLHRVSVAERTVQLCYQSPVDLYPGLLFSLPMRDAYASTIAALDFLMERLRALESPPFESIPINAFRELYKNFAYLSKWYDDGAPESLSFQVIKCSNSFESPPASQWSGFQFGGCQQELIELSSFESDWESAVLRGSTSELCSQQCELAGQSLPKTTPDQAIMFWRRQEGPPGIQIITQTHAPVFHRTTKGKWIGHVMSTLQRRRPDLLETVWCSESNAHALYGYTRLNVNFFQASALCIELSGLIGKPQSQKTRHRQVPKKRGRPTEHDHQQDKKIYDLWKSGTYRSYEELVYHQPSIEG